MKMRKGGREENETREDKEMNNGRRNKGGSGEERRG
jgi:hypothetical protein